MAGTVNNNSTNYQFILNCLIATSAALMLAACLLTYHAAKIAANHQLLIASSASSSPLGLVVAIIGAALFLPYLFTNSNHYHTRYISSIFPNQHYHARFQNSYSNNTHVHPATMGNVHVHGHC